MKTKFINEGLGGVMLINNLNNSKIQYKVKTYGRARRELWKVVHGRLKLGWLRC